MAIDINLDWSAGDHEKPTVRNSTDQNNPISSSQASLQWELTPTKDGVGITGVKFYANKPDKTRKQNPIEPDYLDLPGGHVGDNAATWNINFVANAGPTTPSRLYYDVEFADNDFDDLDWDPILTISPR
jgi:hypothetical protein